MNEIFRKEFLEWVDEDGFYVKDTWDVEKKKWAGPGNVSLLPVQRRILGHVLTLKEDGTFPYTTIVWSTPKKQGKTLTGALLTSWFAECAPEGTECYVVANGLEQAEGRVMKDVKYHYSHVDLPDNPKLNQYDVKFRNGTFIRALSQSFASNAGSRHAFVEFDELWGCTDPTTEILTKSGWKTYDQLVIGELVATWRDEKFEWCPLEAVNVYPYSGTMYHMKHRRCDMFLTPNHRVLGRFRRLGVEKLHQMPWEFREAEHAARSYEGEVPSGCGWDVPYQDFILPEIETNGFGWKKKIHWEARTIPMGDWMEFLGYYLSEGCIIYTQKDGNPCAVSISQSHEVHPETCKRIEACLDRLGFPWSRLQKGYRISGAQLAYYVERIIPKGAPNKRVPEQFKNVDRESLGRFIVSFMDGDGWFAGSGYQTQLSSPGLIDDVAEIGIKCGFTPRYMGMRRVKSPNSDHMSSMYRLSLSIGPVCYGKRRWSKEEYDGIVWCPTTGNGTWLARRNGSVYWTGNSTSELDRRMWDEMTPIPTVPYSLRLITTYAGFMNESDLLWELYLQGVGPTEHPDGRGKPVPELADITDSMGNPVCWSNGKLFTFWIHEPISDWTSEEYLNDQAVQLRPSAYLRLHENRWVTTHESYIPIEWWDRAVNPDWKQADLWAEHPFRWSQIFVGVDASSKRDSTAVVGVGYDAKRGEVGLAFHKIWIPREQELFDHETTVEKYIREKKAQGFRIAEIVYDPAHFVQTANRLRVSGFKMTEYTQSVTNMTIASQKLYDLMKSKAIRVYPSDELRTHILNCVAQEETRGFRIVKQKDAGRVWKPIDAAIALAMACYRAVESGGVDFSTPTIIQSPFSDVTAWKHNTGQQFGWPFDP